MALSAIDWIVIGAYFTLTMLVGLFMGRFGEAVDLLGCVNWLLDDSVSSFVTGITVPVDGGFLSSAGV